MSDLEKIVDNSSSGKGKKNKSKQTLLSYS